MEDGNINHLIGDGNIKICVFCIKWQKKFLCANKIYFCILNYFYYNLINLR